MVRINLGRWRDFDQSKRLARDLAVAQAERHLGAGYDVVVPQLLARPEFIGVLELVARGADATFIEVLLAADVDVVVTRFSDRRPTTQDHPALEIPPRELPMSFPRPPTLSLSSPRHGFRCG
jgi:hypothetical protein